MICVEYVGHLFPAKIKYERDYFPCSYTRAEPHALCNLLSTWNGSTSLWLQNLHVFLQTGGFAEDMIPTVCFFLKNFVEIKFNISWSYHCQFCYLRKLSLQDVRLVSRSLHNVNATRLMCRSVKICFRNLLWWFSRWCIRCNVGGIQYA